MRSKRRASQYKSQAEYLRGIYMSNKKQIDQALNLRIGHKLKANQFNAFKSIYYDALTQGAKDKAAEYGLAEGLEAAMQTSISYGKTPDPYQLLNKILQERGQRKVRIPYKHILDLTAENLHSRDYRSGLGIIKMLKSSNPYMFNQLRKATGWNTAIDPNRISFLKYTIDRTQNISENYIAYVGKKGNYFFKIVGTRIQVESMDKTSYEIRETSDEALDMPGQDFSFRSNIRGSLDQMDYLTASSNPSRFVSRDMPISFKRFKKIFMGVKEDEL